MDKIFVAGSINMDIVVRLKELPRPGETIFGNDLHYIPGGKGCNQAVATSRLGKTTYLIGKLGKDEFGNSLVNFLFDEEIKLDYLFFSDTHPTGVALISVDQYSENSITVISGSNYQLTEQDVEQVQIEKGDVVVSVFEIPQPTILHLFERAKLANAITVLNPSPAKPFLDGLLETVDYLIVNEVELAFFSGMKKVSEEENIIVNYAKKIRKKPSQTIIVTLGAKGVICISGNDVINLTGIKVNPVDTTGAGDCFSGAFASAISEQMEITRAIKFANVAASYSVQKLGASTSMPYRKQVENAIGGKLNPHPPENRELFL